MHSTHDSYEYVSRKLLLKKILEVNGARVDTSIR